MSTRVVAALWLVLGVAVWSGFFDLYVSRGAREYGQLRVEYELGRGPDPDMTQVMARAAHDGVRASTIWAALVVGAGWGTLRLAARTRRREQPGVARRRGGPSDPPTAPGPEGPGLHS